jgi:hypothetical protein
MSQDKIEKYDAWQYEYVYYKNPLMDTSGANSEEIFATLKKTDFRSEEARIFGIGFEACKNLVKTTADKLAGIIMADL